MSQHFRLLNEAQVKSLLPMSDLIEAMENALARFSAGDVLQPVRTVLTVGPTKAYFGVMPAYLPQPARLGAKLVTVFGGNEARGLPSHLATIVLLDADTGALQAILDGRYITEARTAAVSAVSARHLARAGASRLAIIGSGVQARSHLEALAEVRSLREVRVWSPR
jgi:alanine dehydrogenase